MAATDQPGAVRDFLLIWRRSSGLDNRRRDFRAAGARTGVCFGRRLQLVACFPRHVFLRRLGRNSADLHHFLAFRRVLRARRFTRYFLCA